MAYDWVIVAYFFLAGLSAGAYLFSVGANYWKQEYKHLAKRSAVLSLMALGGGLLATALHLGRPDRIWQLYASYNPQSMLSLAAWLLLAFGLIILIYTGLLLAGKEDKAKFFGYLGIPLAVFTAIYAAIHINQAPDRILWHTALIPILFFNGAIISGLAAVMLLSAGQRNTEIMTKLGKYLACLLMVELGMILSEVILLLKGGTESFEVALFLLSGKTGVLFLGFEIVLGAIIPTVILLKGKNGILFRVVVPLLVLIGIFVMRYVIVVGGQLAS